MVSVLGKPVYVFLNLENLMMRLHAMTRHERRRDAIWEIVQRGQAQYIFLPLLHSAVRLSDCIPFCFSLSHERSGELQRRTRQLSSAVGLPEVDYNVITRYVRALRGASFRT